MSCNSSIGDGNWHHVVWTWQRNNPYIATCYIDGKFSKSTTFASYWGATDLSNSRSLLIGKEEIWNGMFTGQIDEAKIFNYALTGTQVKLLYNQNSALRFGL